MISLHSMLFTAEELPKFVGMGAAVLLAVAFIVGFIKGFRKVGWGGLIWLTTGALFLWLGVRVDASGSVTRRFTITMLFVLLYVAAALAAYGILAYFLRPKTRWVKDKVNGNTSLAEYGLEFEPEYLDYDGEHDAKPYGKRIHKTGHRPPKLLGRLLGGAACVLNVGMILWAIISFLLLCINGSELSNMKIGLVLNNEVVAKLLDFAKRACFDWLCIGIILAIAKKGFEKGFMSSLRELIVTFGTMALVVGCFYLPFSAYATRTTGIFVFLDQLLTRSAAVVGNTLPFAAILAKVLAGAFLAVIAGVLMFLVNILLKKCCHMVSKASPTRTVDKVLACALYVAVGAVVCIGIWCILALLENVNLFTISEMLSEEATLSNNAFEFAKELLSKLTGFIKK